MFSLRSIQGIIVLIVGIFLSIWLGMSIVTDQTETIIQIVSICVILFCFYLGRRIWLIIPFLATLNLQLRLPSQPNTLFIGELLVIVFISILLLMRKQPFRWVFSELDFWILVIFAFTAQTYARNPVGINVLSGDTVGGKAYWIFCIDLIVAFILMGLQVPHHELKTYFRLSVLGGISNFAVNIVGLYVPAVGLMLGQSYMSSEETKYDNMNKMADAGAVDRRGHLLPISSNSALWLCSFISPLRALFSVRWLPLLMFSVIAAGLSGFRNGIISVICIYAIGIAYRGGVTSIITSVFIGSMMLFLMAIGNLIYPFPPNIQRALTFLPGTWEQRYRDDAKESSEWRYEIWKEALTSEKWIHNKWWGDGLGYSMEELQRAMSLKEGIGVSGFNIHRETILINGDYHSGPVQTIRTIGYLGLIALLLAMTRLAVHAHRQIIRCRGTEWYPLALLVGIPLIYYPIYFILVFGTFSLATNSFLIGCGIVRLLENNLPLPTLKNRDGAFS